VRVMHDYTAQYPDPITVRAGDRVLSWIPETCLS